jgi:hypothetical protein
VLLVIGLLAAGATVFNVASVIELSRRDTRLTTQTARDVAAAADLRNRAARLRATVDPRALETASADAMQANELIDRRTFSWTDLFNRFETALPDDVHFSTVRPKLDPKRGIVITIVVDAKSVNDVNLFIEHLEATGAFAELQKLDEGIDEQNQLQATIEGVYTPQTAHRDGGDQNQLQATIEGVYTPQTAHRDGGDR